MLNSFEDLQSINLDLASLVTSITETKHTLVDKDINIHEDITPFSLRLSALNAIGETINIEINAVHHVIRDEWFGFVIDQVKAINNDIEPHKFSLLFKQRLQGLLFLNNDLLDRLA